jgi:hypothetical protein
MLFSNRPRGWLCLGVLACVLPACNSGPSPEELDRQRAEQLVSQYRQPVAERLERYVELGRDLEQRAIPEGGDHFPGVAADFQEHENGKARPAWNAVLITEAKFEELVDYMTHQRAERSPTPVEPPSIGSFLPKDESMILLDTPELRGDWDSKSGTFYRFYAQCLFEPPSHIGSADVVQRYCDELLQVRYVLLVQQTAAKRAWLGEDQSFEGGELGANVYVLDVAEGKYLGGFPVHATSSEKLTVEYEKSKDSDTFARDVSAKTKRDVEDNFHQALWAEIQRRMPDANLPKD